MTQTVQVQPVPLHSVDQVRDRVAQIADLAWHGEHYTAARLERALWDDVLEAIAGCNAQAGYLAAEALKTKAIDFPRPGTA